MGAKPADSLLPDPALGVVISKTTGSALLQSMILELHLAATGKVEVAVSKLVLVAQQLNLDLNEVFV